MWLQQQLAARLASATATDTLTWVDSSTRPNGPFDPQVAIRGLVVAHPKSWNPLQAFVPLRLRLLGCHSRSEGRAHLVRVRPHGRREGAGQAEVGDLERQGGRVDEQVGGLEVPVQHPPRVQVLDALHQLPHQPLQHTAAVSAPGAMSTRKDSASGWWNGICLACSVAFVAPLRLHCVYVLPCTASGIQWISMMHTTPTGRRMVQAHRLAWDKVLIQCVQSCQSVGLW